jgi:ribosome-associated toxin RatA of RatAB toxin-antitoxin module
MKKIARSAIVAHSAEQLYDLVQDIEAYPRFLPWCREARVLERGPAGTRASLTVGLRALRQSFTTHNVGQPGRAIDMRLVEGPFRSFAAAWRFSPLSPQACNIEFSLQYEFSSRALGRLLEPLFDNIADTMVDAFMRRADEVHGRAEG